MLVAAEKKDFTQGVRDRRRPSALPYVLAIPIVLLVGSLVFVPIVSGVWASLHRSELGSDVSTWVGLDNYERLLADSGAGNALFVTLVFTVAVVSLALGTGLVVALALNRVFRFRSVARVLLTIPWAFPEVPAILVFLWILNPSFGVANLFARTLPWVSENPTWLLDPTLALPLVVLITVWKIFPFYGLVFLAALQTIPVTLIEAAKVDGADVYRVFRNITLPWLSPTVALLGILASIYAFKHFTLIWLLTGGGPGVATETLVVRTYSTAFRFYDVSYGNTLGAAGLMVVLVVTAAFLYVQHSFGVDASEG